MSRNPPALPASPPRGRSATPTREARPSPARPFLQVQVPDLSAQERQTPPRVTFADAQPEQAPAGEQDALVTSSGGAARRKLGGGKGNSMHSRSSRDLIKKDGPSTEAMKKFNELDADGSGFLDRAELQKLIESLPRAKKLNGKKMAKALDAIDPQQTGKVSFQMFQKWWVDAKESDRRAQRRSVKDAFDAVDSDGSGTLTKDEFKQVATKAGNLLGLLPPFDLESDWMQITRDVHHDALHGDVDRNELTVSFMLFESWWKERLGVDSADIPVLPEYMVQVVDEHSTIALKRKTSANGGIPHSPTIVRTGVGLWHTLKERLLSLVRMQAQWGNLHDIYAAQAESRYTQEPLPKWIRDPESRFSTIWDLLQVVFLLYVSIAVPIRACFDVEVSLWSFGFLWDMMVDLYFITDVVLNFRTAFYHKDGTLEDRIPMIRAHYLRGWFTVDFVSSLPLGYIPYFFDIEQAAAICTDCSAGGVGAEEQETTTLKAVKALRLVRLSKMLRLARMRKILSKYGGDVNLQVFVSIGFTIFVIFFLVHMLTCGWYIIGKQDQELPSGHTIPGWVTSITADDAEWDASKPPPSIGTRYLSSTYLVMNSLENGFTDGEKAFAVFSEFVRDFILGLVAGLITTVSMSMNTFGEGSQEGQLRLRDLKNWMQKKNLPKALQMPITEYCHEIWNNRSGLNVNEFFCDVPPTMRLHLTNFLYGPTIARNPLFRGLSVEVTSSLCNRVHAMYVMPQQKVICEGEPGREMYMIITGELEVASRGERLGFLSEGSFFGEAAVMSEGHQMEMLRTRTITAVTDSELCYLTQEDLSEMKQQFVELAARLRRFTAHGQMRLTKKATRKLFGEDGEEMRRTYSSTFKSLRTAVQTHKAMRSHLQHTALKTHQIKFTDALKQMRVFADPTSDKGSSSPAAEKSPPSTPGDKEGGADSKGFRRLEEKVDLLLEERKAMQQQMTEMAALVTSMVEANGNSAQNRANDLKAQQQAPVLGRGPSKVSNGNRGAGASGSRRVAVAVPATSAPRQVVRVSSRATPVVKPDTSRR